MWKSPEREHRSGNAVHAATTTPTGAPGKRTLVDGLGPAGGAVARAASDTPSGLDGAEAGQQGRGSAGPAGAPAITDAAAAATLEPLPRVDAAGNALTTHADVTLEDAVNAPTPVPSGTEARAANVKVIADRARPLATGPTDRPSPEQLYQEAPGSPTPPGFTAVTGFDGTIAAPQVEQVISDALFLGDQPSPNDVQQGGIGDCYFMAVLMSVAQRDPGRLRSMIVPDGQGAATVTFWHRQVPVRSRLDQLFGVPPLPQYEQVAIHVSEQLPYRLKTPLGSGQRAPNDHGGFLLAGARLRAAAHAGSSKWWAQLEASELDVHRRDEYDAARWAPLMEKALAAFVERYGESGGSQGEGPAQGSGYDAIKGGWPHEIMFVIYGPDADAAGPNQGQVQQQETHWAPGANVLAENPRVVDQLILLQGRGDTPPPGERTAPILTASSMVHGVIPRLLTAIPVAQADPDWANVSAAEQTHIAAVTAAIHTYEALPADPPDAPKGPRWQAYQAIGTASSTAILMANAPTLHAPGRSAAIQAMVELVLDLKNLGTDQSPHQRNIYGNHVYSVVAVEFCDASGAPVPLHTTAPAQRSALLPRVDTAVSNITLRNPHHGNTPDPTGSGVGPGGPTTGVRSSGIFHMNLEQFFRNYTSVESGVFPKT